MISNGIKSGVVALGVIFLISNFASAAIYSVNSGTDWRNEGMFFNTTTSSNQLQIGTHPLFDGFEDSDMAEYSLSGESKEASNSSPGGVPQGRYIGNVTTNSNGDETIASRNIAKINGTTIEWYAMSTTASNSGAEWTGIEYYTGSGSTKIIDSRLNCEQGGEDDSYSINGVAIHEAPVCDRWYHVELKEIDWANDNIGEVYVNGQLNATDVSFANSGSDVDHIKLISNSGETYQAYFDLVTNGTDEAIQGNWTGDTKAFGSSERSLGAFQVNVLSLPTNSHVDAVLLPKDNNNDTIEKVTCHIEKIGLHNYSCAAEVGNFDNFRLGFNMTGQNSPKINSTSVFYSGGDTKSPNITIYNPTNTTLNENQVDLNVTADETIGTWQYALDSGPNTTFTPNTTLSRLSMGQHHLVMYANDSSGNNVSSDVYFTVSDDDAWVNATGDDVRGTLDMLGNNILNVGKMVLEDVLDMGENRIINVSDPQEAQDAATKSYVDQQADGLRDSVLYTATADNSTLDVPDESGNIDERDTITVDTSTHPGTINFSTTASSDGKSIVIKDGAGHACNNSITVITQGDIPIDGQDSIRLTSNYESVTLEYSGELGEWGVTSHYEPGGIC